MGRMLSIDGKKRTGIAVTDPLQIIATGLATVETPALMDFLKDYTSRESVEKILMGILLIWMEVKPILQRKYSILSGV